MFELLGNSGRINENIERSVTCILIRDRGYTQDEYVREENDRGEEGLCRPRSR